MLKFASISYLNLLPFQIFIKKHIASTQIKQIMRYRRSVPSQINQEFKKKRIDAAFISSIKSKNQKCTNAGIIANKKVYSVQIETIMQAPNESKVRTANVKLHGACLPEKRTPFASKQPRPHVQLLRGSFCNKQP